MKTVLLKRNQSTSDGTFGKLSIDTNSWYSLELPWKDNKSQISCIPTGTYLCKWINSPKHGKCYQIMNVVNRSMVEIHSANWAGDSSLGKHCQLLGCIALGKSIGILENQNALLSSKVAIAEFESLMNKEDFKLIIS